MFRDAISNYLVDPAKDAAIDGAVDQVTGGGDEEEEEHEEEEYEEEEYEGEDDGGEQEGGEFGGFFADLIGCFAGEEE